MVAGPHKIGDYMTETDFYGDYARGARMVQQGRIVPARYGVVGPVYEVTLALAGFIVRDLFLAAQLLSVAAMTGALLAWFFLLRRRVGARVALLGVLFTATNAHFFHYGYAATTDALALMLQAGALYLLLASRGPRAMPGAGLLAAVAFLTRYNAIYLLPAGLIAALGGATGAAAGGATPQTRKPAHERAATGVPRAAAHAARGGPSPASGARSARVRGRLLRAGRAVGALLARPRRRLLVPASPQHRIRSVRTRQRHPVGHLSERAPAPVQVAHGRDPSRPRRGLRSHAVQRGRSHAARCPERARLAGRDGRHPRRRAGGAGRDAAPAVAVGCGRGAALPHAGSDVSFRALLGGARARLRDASRDRLRLAAAGARARTAGALLAQAGARCDPARLRGPAVGRGPGARDRSAPGRGAGMRGDAAGAQAARRPADRAQVARRLSRRRRGPAVPVRRLAARSGALRAREPRAVALLLVAGSGDAPKVLSSARHHRRGARAHAAARHVPAPGGAVRDRPRFREDSGLVRERHAEGASLTARAAPGRGRRPQDSPGLRHGLGAAG
ncbi:MAG: glycosyltransferase family 39 protein [Candidatus Eisenbacteria bacterium]|uniref:Glycosyltransferase family 39 protein n=1 Tax=Eiseniibacteriota bacterium TaxID=2212470 RepID=A0A538TB26_UNCEI|nr:MAG: glycosyltransferase family 39 protein [Candidatus Eisenbacteria bacterium]